MAASIVAMKVALGENETLAGSIINDLTASFDELCLEAELNVRDELKEKLKAKSLFFKSYAWREKESKLNKLRNKDSTSDNKVLQDNFSCKNKRKWVKKSKYKRLKKTKLRQKISVVFNYSSITLTPSMEKVLNRGLNYAYAFEIKHYSSIGELQTF